MSAEKTGYPQGYGQPPAPMSGYGPQQPPMPGYGPQQPPMTGYGQQPMVTQPQYTPQYGQPAQVYTNQPQIHTGQQPVRAVRQTPDNFVIPQDFHGGNRGPCPPGLEYLAQIDQIIIKQQIELLEVLTGFETNNKYRVYNSMGQQIYYAAEETSCLMRQCCSAARGFTIHITDNNNYEVMKIVREFKCCAGCAWCASSDCCALELSVEAPPGHVIGYVRQMQYCWAPVLGLFDENHQQFGRIEGPCCVCNSPCCGDVEFPVYTIDKKSSIGMCAKQWSGALVEMFTDADTFNVRFPTELDAKLKATMIAAMFMLDFMFFEEIRNKHNNRSIL